MQVLFARWASQRQSRIVAVGVFLGLAAIGVNRLRRGTALPHNADSEVAHPVTGGEPIEFDPKLTAPWWYFGIDIALIAFLVMVLLAALRLFNSILPPSEDIVTPWIGNWTYIETFALLALARIWGYYRSATNGEALQALVRVQLGLITSSAILLACGWALHWYDLGKPNSSWAIDLPFAYELSFPLLIFVVGLVVALRPWWPEWMGRVLVRMRTVSRVRSWSSSLEILSLATVVIVMLWAASILWRPGGRPPFADAGPPNWPMGYPVLDSLMTLLPREDLFPLSALFAIGIVEISRYRWLRRYESLQGLRWSQEQLVLLVGRL